MGGVIIIDFIDMRDEKHRRAVDKALRDAMKPDRAKTKILKISPLGMVEMTRQRMRPSLKASMYSRCDSCDGTGFIKSPESQALAAMRNLRRALHNSDVAEVTLSVTPAVAHHLSNYQRQQITAIEHASGKVVIIEADPDLEGEQMHLAAINARGSEVAWEAPLIGKGKTKLQTEPAKDLRPRGAELDMEFDEDEDEQPEESTAPESATDEMPAEEGEGAPKKRRRSRRRRRKTAEQRAQEQQPQQHDDEAQKTQEPAEKLPAPGAEEESGRPADAAEGEGEAPKKRRRGRRGGRKHKRRSEGSQEAQAGDENQQPQTEAQASQLPEARSERSAEAPKGDVSRPSVEAGEGREPQPAPANDSPSQAPAGGGPAADNRGSDVKAEGPEPAPQPAREPAQKPEPTDDNKQEAQPAKQPEAEPAQKKKPATRKKATRKKAVKKTAGRTRKAASKAAAPDPDAIPDPFGEFDEG
jgi:ribonuclease E